MSSYISIIMLSRCVSPRFSSVQSLSSVQLFATPWTVARQAFLFITNSQSLLKFMSIELVMLSNHLILCCPLLPLDQFCQRFSLFPYFFDFSKNYLIGQFQTFFFFTLCYINFCLYILELYLNLLILINYIYLKHGVIYGSNYVFDL